MLKINKIKPLFNTIVTTMDKYDSDESNGTLIVKQKGTLKEYQTVVAVGPSVKNIEVGDKVMINPIRYAVKKHQDGSLKDGVITDNPVISYNFNTVEIDGKPHLILFDQDIMYVFEGEEIQETIVVPKKEIIL